MEQGDPRFMKLRPIMTAKYLRESGTSLRRNSAGGFSEYRQNESSKKTSGTGQRTGKPIEGTTVRMRLFRQLLSCA
jgi:hypothetical protein